MRVCLNLCILPKRNLSLVAVLNVFTSVSSLKMAKCREMVLAPLCNSSVQTFIMDKHTTMNGTNPCLLLQEYPEWISMLSKSISSTSVLLPRSPNHYIYYTKIVVRNEIIFKVTWATYCHPFLSVAVRRPSCINIWTFSIASLKPVNRIQSN